VTTACAGCVETIDHCHGTLVRHADGMVECTDLSCVVLAVERHELVLACGPREGCSCDPAAPAG
jgi:hypothetical protein